MSLGSQHVDHPRQPVDSDAHLDRGCASSARGASQSSHGGILVAPEVVPRSGQWVSLNAVIVMPTGGSVTEDDVVEISKRVRVAASRGTEFRLGWGPGS